MVDYLCLRLQFLPAAYFDLLSGYPVNHWLALIYDGELESILGGMIGFSIFCLFYFLPALVAYLRKHPSYTSIILVNFLLGWTGLGWIILLFYAFKEFASPGGMSTNVNVNQNVVSTENRGREP